MAAAAAGNPSVVAGLPRIGSPTPDCVSLDDVSEGPQDRMSDAEVFDEDREGSMDDSKQAQEGSFSPVVPSMPSCVTPPQAEAPHMPGAVVQDAVVQSSEPCRVESFPNLPEIANLQSSPSSPSKVESCLSVVTSAEGAKKDDGSSPRQPAQPWEPVGARHSTVSCESFAGDALANLLKNSFRRMEADLANSHATLLEELCGAAAIEPGSTWNDAPPLLPDVDDFGMRRQDNSVLQPRRLSRPSVFLGGRGSVSRRSQASRATVSKQSWVSEQPSLGRCIQNGGEPGELELLPIWTRSQSMCEGKKMQKMNTFESFAKSRVQSMDQFEEEARDTHWTIHPYNPIRSCWDLTSLGLVLYDMVMIPLQLFDLDAPFFLAMMSWVTRLFWTGDIPLTFFSGYISRTGHIERSRRLIATRYVRTWFSTDLLIVLLDWSEPILDLMSGVTGVSRLSKFTRIFRIIRMVRLLRIAKIGHIITILLEQVCSEKLRIIIGILQYMMLMVMSTHMMACLWYSMASMEDSSPGWVPENECDGEHVAYCYVVSFRWALAQFGGGMDEVVPTTFTEHMFAVFAYMISFWAGAVLISTFTALMTQFFIDGSQQNMQLNMLRRYLEQNRISKNLALRLTRNAKHALLERRKMVHEEFVEVVMLLSEPLRRELRFEIYGPSLRRHPFFHVYMVQCSSVSKRICHNAMSMMVVSPGDIVFNAGEIPREPRMFLINHGLLWYTHNGGNREVGEESFVSEATLWVSWTHRGCLTALEDCRLYTLDAAQFQATASSFDYNQDFDPRLYAERIVSHMNSIMPPLWSDVMSTDELEIIVLSDVEGPPPSGSASQKPRGSSQSRR